jgi:Zn finger protein HypA/HybF involved in hydrogenase expression
MGVAEAILETALAIADGRPVLRVAVSAGEQQALSADALTFSFELAAADTLAAGALLEVRPMPGSRLAVDAVEVGGAAPEVLRRRDAEVVEAAHAHPHEPTDQPIHPAWL